MSDQDDIAVSEHVEDDVRLYEAEQDITYVVEQDIITEIVTDQDLESFTPPVVSPSNSLADIPSHSPLVSPGDSPGEDSS